MLYKRFRWISMMLLAVLLASVLTPGAALAGGKGRAGGKVVVANRGSGTISVINAKTITLEGSYALPASPNAPEPMYVVPIPSQQRVFVGDRANNSVVVFDSHTFEVETSLPVGAGVFHMWGEQARGQLWVVADIDKAVTVIDLNSLTTVATIPIPADLAAMGGFPHDVILDQVNSLAFVSILGVSGADDYVIQYSTETFAESGRAAVGKDPHLSLARQNNKLYVPCQSSAVVVVLDRISMAELTRIDQPGAHGAGMVSDGSILYTTNLPGGGSGGLVAIDTNSDTVISPATDTPYPVPHNIAISPNGRKLFVTHSGPTADKVTFYLTKGNDPRPIYYTDVTVGLNPFGLAYVP